jgi:putative ABC transport system ATP-binding protein
VFIDEPTSALDTALAAQALTPLRHELSGRGDAAVIVTHDERMGRRTDRRTHLLDGQLTTT